VLAKLQALLQRGGAVTIDQAACELDTSPEVVRGLLDHLARTGVLRQMTASCNSACTGCTLARDCGRSTQGLVWQMQGR
jgi:predicted ArsR family transcriptional regulator